MKHVYPVLCRGSQCGDVSVEKSGLYLRISMECHIPARVRFRLKLSATQKERDLGLCASDHGKFSYVGSLSLKDAGEPPYCFTLEEEREGSFYPVEEGIPCPQLRKLQQARFSAREGICGVVVSD